MIHIIRNETVLKSIKLNYKTSVSVQSEPLHGSPSILDKNVVQRGFNT